MWQLRDIQRRRNSLTQISVHQQLIQDQLVSPENMHTSNHPQTNQVVFRNVNVYMYMRVTIIN